MFFVNMFLEPSFSAKAPGAISTFVPMLFLLVRQAELSVVGWPSSVAPAAFDLVGMCVAVVVMLSKSLGFESPATACIHCGRGSKLETSVGWEDVNDKMFLPSQSDVKALYSAAPKLIKRLESSKSFDVLKPYPMAEVN